MRGFAASSGIVEGTARVVKTVEEIGRLKQGDILVCRVTNPTWAPIFQKISAAVSDIGGSMSHAAIVAREYGLPAVVGTGDATVRIRTASASASTATRPCDDPELERRHDVIRMPSPGSPISVWTTARPWAARAAASAN